MFLLALLFIQFAYSMELKYLLNPGNPDRSLLAFEVSKVSNSLQDKIQQEGVLDANGVCSAERCVYYRDRGRSEHIWLSHKVEIEACMAKSEGENYNNIAKIFYHPRFNYFYKCEKNLKCQFFVANSDKNYVVRRLRQHIQDKHIKEIGGSDLEKIYCKWDGCAYVCIDMPLLRKHRAEKHSEKCKEIIMNDPYNCSDRTGKWYVYSKWSNEYLSLCSLCENFVSYGTSSSSMSSTMKNHRLFNCSSNKKLR